MQRLNAIFSFIKGEFSVTINGVEGFFDLQTMASSKARMDSNLLVQKYPLLDKELCLKVASYQLPFSITNLPSSSLRVHP